MSLLDNNVLGGDAFGWAGDRKEALEHASGKRMLAEEWGIGASTNSLARGKNHVDEKNLKIVNEMLVLLTMVVVFLTMVPTMVCVICVVLVFKK